MTDPTIPQITDACNGRYISLVRRRIGRRYLLVHFNPHVFMLGIGVEFCKYGAIWFIGPVSIILAKPGDTP